MLHVGSLMFVFPLQRPDSLQLAGPSLSVWPNQVTGPKRDANNLRLAETAIIAYLGAQISHYRVSHPFFNCLFTFFGPTDSIRFSLVPLMAPKENGLSLLLDGKLLFQSSAAFE